MHIYQTLQTLHYSSSAESPPENRLTVMLNWVLKAAGILWLEHTFFKDKTGIKLLFHWEWNAFLNYAVLLRNQHHHPFPLLFPVSRTWRQIEFLKWFERVACVTLTIYMVWLESETCFFRAGESWNVQYAGFTVYSCKREEAAHSIYRNSYSFYS